MLSIRNPLAVAVATALLGGCAHLPSRSDVKLETPQAWDATVSTTDAAAATAIWPDAASTRGLSVNSIDAAECTRMVSRNGGCMRSCPSAIARLKCVS